jgi:OOP family OmpA-OmpF porin
LSTAGLGSEKPVADNATVEGRKKNRRIEFEVL